MNKKNTITLIVLLCFAIDMIRLFQEFSWISFGIATLLMLMLVFRLFKYYLQ